MFLKFLDSFYFLINCIQDFLSLMNFLKVKTLIFFSLFSLLIKSLDLLILWTGLIGMCAMFWYPLLTTNITELLFTFTYHMIAPWRSFNCLFTIRTEPKIEKLNKINRIFSNFLPVTNIKAISIAMWSLPTPGANKIPTSFAFNNIKHFIDSKALTATKSLSALANFNLFTHGRITPTKNLPELVCQIFISLCNKGAERIGHSYGAITLAHNTRGEGFLEGIL